MQSGKKDGGLGEGIFARLRPPTADMGWERLRTLAESVAKQNRFGFHLEENGSRAKNKKDKDVLLCAAGFRRAEPRGGVFFLLQLFRILLEVSSNFFQKTPPKVILETTRIFFVIICLCS